MFHALFDLESEPDPHPKSYCDRVCAGGNGFVECWQNTFRTNFINTIQYNTIQCIYSHSFTKKTCYIIEIFFF